MELGKQQEIILYLSDMLIELYAAESVLLRVHRVIQEQGVSGNEEKIAIAKTYIYDAANKINWNGRNAINAFATGDEQRMMLMGLKRFTKTQELNTVATRQLIANKIIQSNQYPF